MVDWIRKQRSYERRQEKLRLHRYKWSTTPLSWKKNISFGHAHRYCSARFTPVGSERTDCHVKTLRHLSCHEHAYPFDGDECHFNHFRIVSRGSVTSEDASLRFAHSKAQKKAQHCFRVHRLILSNLVSKLIIHFLEVYSFDFMIYGISGNRLHVVWLASYVRIDIYYKSLLSWSCLNW